MKIDKIVIACFKKDLFLLRPCVASIRYWYPDVEILLLKDEASGSFSTREIERSWKVGLFPTRRRAYGWGWSKLEILLSDKRERILFLDSDVVFLGYVLDMLAAYDQDFVVTGERADKSSHNVNAHYIDTAKLEEFDPSFTYPGFVFNSGQMVMTTGLLRVEDFSPVVDMGDPFRNRYPAMLKHGDQGALNYVLAKAQQRGVVTVAYADFWLWPGMPEAGKIEMGSLKSRKGIPFILHWAGAKPVDFRRYIRADIMAFFNNFYYERVPRGRLKSAARFIGLQAIVHAKILKYRILRMNYV